MGFAKVVMALVVGRIPSSNIKSHTVNCVRCLHVDAYVPQLASPTYSTMGSRGYGRGRRTIRSRHVLMQGLSGALRPSGHLLSRDKGCPATPSFPHSPPRSVRSRGSPTVSSRRGINWPGR